MSIDWNWGIFLQQAPFGNTTYLGWIWSGFQVTIALSICAWIIAFLVGSFFGILRTVPNRFLSGLGTLYVELFRNVPLIVQFFTWYLVIPELLPEKIGMWFKAELDPNIQFFLSSMLCLGLFTAARVCEQVRAAIQSLPRGQKNAALAMGLTLPQAYRYVLLPNAYRVIVPPMTSEMMNLVKNSAIASTIGLVDMAAQAGKILQFSGPPLGAFIALFPAALLYYTFFILVVALVLRIICLPCDLGGEKFYRFFRVSFFPP
ncbi:amino acid ABC transporter permease, partial [Escherichia coli]